MTGHSTEGSLECEPTLSERWFRKDIAIILLLVLSFDLNAQVQSSGLPHQRSSSSGHAEVDAQVSVHRASLRQSTGFPSRDRFHSHAQLLSQNSLGEPQIFAILADLVAGKQAELLAQRPGNLIVGIVIEDQFAA